jgi:hypothetical protein
MGCMHVATLLGLSAGQAIVQMAKCWHSGREYAMKFYISKLAFAAEQALYLDPSNSLTQFLPRVCVLMLKATSAEPSHLQVMAQWHGRVMRMHGALATSGRGLHTDHAELPRRIFHK